jgi:hypothetical protein
MSALTIECPHCQKPFELTEAIATPIVEAERCKLAFEVTKRIDAERAQIEANARADAAAQYEAQIKASTATLADKDRQIEAAKATELAALKAKAEADLAKKDVELVIERRLAAEKQAIADRAKADAESAAATRISSMEAALADKDTKLKEAEAAELVARRMRVEAEEAKQQIELTVERRLDEERARIRERTARERDDAYRLKLAEKDKQLETLAAQIEELNRSGANCSGQLVGEVLEADTFEVLKSAFPQDRIERVRRGHKGCDVVQTVMSPGGLQCGSIAWETKRTKAFQDGWLAKLREDQRDVRADLAVLATETLPTGLAAFEERDGVWITPLATVVPIAAVLRRALIEIATARRAGALADSIKERTFSYLTSSPFRQRVARMIDAYQELRADLDREKRATTTTWNKREKQLDRMLGGLTGLYGDLQGIVGVSLPAIEGLALPSGEAAEADSSSPLMLVHGGTGDA